MKFKSILDSLGYEVQTGHKLCISVSPVYFPLIWTPRTTTQIVIDNGVLILPILTNPSKSRLTNSPFPSKINMGPPLDVQVIKGPTHERYLRNSLSSGHRIVTNEADFGKIYYIDEDVVFSDYTKDSYEIDEHDPLSAKAICTRSIAQDFNVSESSDKVKGMQKTLIETEMFNDFGLRQFQIES